MFVGSVRLKIGIREIHETMKSDKRAIMQLCEIQGLSSRM